MPRNEVHQVKLGTSATAHEGQARRIADALRHALPSHFGFTLFIFDQRKEDGPVENQAHVSYISTANREDMVGTIRTWLAKVSP